MSEKSLVRKFWEDFCRLNPEVDAAGPYQTWFFGDDRRAARELAALVVSGKKRATASLVWEYEKRPGDAPILGGDSVVTDFEGRPLCVLRTTELRVLPFNKVDAEFAFDEGEGDQSLDYWRAAHWDYFSRKCAQLGREPSLEMPINCERFTLLHGQAR